MLEAEKFSADEEIIMINGAGDTFVEEDNDVGFCLNGLKNGSEVSLQTEK